MRYAFRLAELLGHNPDRKRRPGTIKAIVEYTGLDRHQVSALLRNEVKYIPMQALSRLCDYLVEHGHVAPDQLPGALFAVEAEDFWELLARRRRLELCMGVRCEDELGETAWIVASDSVLLGELLNGVSTLGGAARQCYKSGHANRPHPEHLKQTLVWSPGQREDIEVRRLAVEARREFTGSTGDKALVCIGSVKSNPVVEVMMAQTFGCEPFRTQDHVASIDQRACPVFLRYREHDPHHESCSGGLRLSSDHPSPKPGIYYETRSGEWRVCEWDAAERDVAFVFYAHRESQGCLEMALAGFSGRSTRLLAKTLATRAQDFWPPIYEDHGVRIGAFVVQYTLATSDDQARDMLRTDLSAGTKIIPIDREVIERRWTASKLGQDAVSAVS
ncbi:MAG: helix-turn-helix transcriptional regulator [Planctomycetes bacterium]|nr:helix-turn-helix transcriptional regulator [Planctomycetota bacterium]